MKTYLLLFLIGLPVLLFGQVPEQINYQGIARNSVGNVLPNKKISVRLGIREGSGEGTVLYSETRKITTNNFGLFNIAIGGPGAENTTGIFGSIDWSSSARFIKVEIDPDGGSNFISLGSGQLLSVPYALYAGKSAAGLPSGTAGGVLAGNYPNPSIANGAITQSMIAPGVIPTTLPPSGNASGDLTGTYPNPVLNIGVVTTEKLADLSVTTLKIADLSVTTPKLADGSVTGIKIAPGVIPTSLPPSGTAGGDLNGTYPNPLINNGAVTTIKLADLSVNTLKIADMSVTTPKLADGSVTSIKIAPGVIPTSLPPSGTAGGDLNGTYPNPLINNGAVTTTKLADLSVTTPKIADGSVTSIKIAPGVIPTSLPPSGTAGGDLSGTYPNPFINEGAITTTKLADLSVNTLKIADLSVTTPKLADGSVTDIKIADNAITTSKVMDASITLAKLGPDVILGGSGSPTGPAGGDLSGTYPNPNLAAGSVTIPKIANGSVITPKLGDGSVTTVKIADLSVNTAKISDASVTSPKLADGAVNNIKIADNSITTSKVMDASITLAKLGPDVILGGSGSPTGPAGGDLTGTYPNPVINTGAISNSKLADLSVNTSKLADLSVTTPKLADGAVTGIKIAPGVIPTSLPPSGVAGGDLSGSYPNPLVSKIQGIGINNTIPVNGQVLKFNGTDWAPGLDNGLSLPYAATINSAQNLISLTNSGTGAGLEGINSSTNSNAFGVMGMITSTNPGVSSAAVRGINSGTGFNGAGVWGSHNGGGFGIHGSSVNGIGVYGTSTNFTSGLFEISNTLNASDALTANTIGSGNGIMTTSDYGHGVLAITFSDLSAGVLGYNFGGGEAVVGRNFSNSSGAVVGRNDGNYAGVAAISGGDNGIGIHALANVNGTLNSNAVVAEIEGSGAGNPAVFKANGANVARIDHTGKGYFNNGTQNSGADIAEIFEVTGNINSYEPGDVLIISTSKNRAVEKSNEAYSTLVAGVYATKPGILLTEESIDSDLSDKVPMGVIGVIPTKVCLEGGPIKRGDLLVTSSLAGVAMKADMSKVKIGQVLGKALEDYNSNGIGIINVLVSVK